MRSQIVGKEINGEGWESPINSPMPQTPTPEQLDALRPKPQQQNELRPLDALRLAYNGGIAVGGARMIVAEFERLQQKIAALEARVHELESTLVTALEQ